MARAVADELAARFARIRAGVDVGFADAAATRSFRAFRSEHGGVWMTVEDGPSARAAAAAEVDPKTVLTMGLNGELPFEDHQFEVVLLAPGLIAGDRVRAEALVRESHRVLQGGGCLIFAVDFERCGFTQRGIYELLRDGFDVVGVRRPAWWKFGLGGRATTVCARRKTWRNRGVPIVGETMPVSSAMLSARSGRAGVR